VPTLRDGDNIIHESLAIMAYLDRKYPDPPLYGLTPVQAGRIWQRILEFENYADEPIRSIILPLYFGTAEARADEIRAARKPVHTELALLETALCRSEWVCSGGLSAADIAIYPAIKSLERAASKPAAPKFDLQMLPIGQHYPGIGTWMARIEALPYYQHTYPPHW
jgi:glutathione S-transferase